MNSPAIISYETLQGYHNYKNKKICRARKGLGTNLVLRCYTGLEGSDFLCKVTLEMTTGDTIHSLDSFIYSLPTQQDCDWP